MEIDVNLPGLLRDSVDGQRSLRVSGTTLQEALDDLMQRYPVVARHLYDERGQLRQHVLIFYNSENIAWLPSRDVPLRDGDVLHVLQAVSGG